MAVVFMGLSVWRIGRRKKSERPAHGSRVLDQAHVVGEGEGEGFNLNLPMERGTLIADYCRSLETALQRVSDFKPDVLVVAAGLDIAVDDPFKGFAIATPEFATIGKIIAQLPIPKLVVQEGGYPSPSLGRNLASLLRGLGA